MQPINSISTRHPLLFVLKEKYALCDESKGEFLYTGVRNVLFKGIINGRYIEQVVKIPAMAPSDSIRFEPKLHDDGRIEIKAVPA